MSVQNEIALIVAAYQKVFFVIIAYAGNLHSLSTGNGDRAILVHSQQSASVTSYIYVSVFGIAYGIDDVLWKI